MYKFLEARDRIGGRIYTLKNGNANLEMGATWFNTAHQNFQALLQEFEIDFFEQFMKGTAFYETEENNPAQIIELPDDNSSYRIVGGTSQIITKIKNELKNIPIHLNDKVETLDFTNEKVKITTNKATFEADLVINTIPPNLFVSSINFTPSLPEKTIQIAQNTHTWMQDSIKVALVYKTPFWRNKAISGTFFSTVGPITEFYDHSTYNLEGFALCGFMSSTFNMFPEEERKSKVLLQLEKIFGKEALDFIDYQETIWSEEEFTKNKKQEGFIFPHQNNGHSIFREPYFENRLFHAGTETAAQFPGYMEGAVRSANQIVSIILNL